MPGKVRDARDKQKIVDLMKAAKIRDPRGPLRIRLAPYIYLKGDNYNYRPIRGIAWTVLCADEEEARELIGVFNVLFQQIEQEIPLGEIRARLRRPSVIGENEALVLKAEAVEPTI